MDYLKKAGSVINIDNKYYIKTPNLGTNWDLVEVRRKENGHYTFDILAYNCQLEYNLKKIIQLNLQAKHALFSLREFIKEYRNLMNEINLIFNNE